MGLAYTSAELCYCYAKIGDMDKACIYEQQVKKICKDLPHDSVKWYCLSKISKAMKELV